MIVQDGRRWGNGVLAGFAPVWAENLGCPEVTIAVLDGPVDRAHASLAAANLTLVATPGSSQAHQGPAAQHGTHIASIIFGQHDSDIKGIAPRCRGLILPIFRPTLAGGFEACSQFELANAVAQAVRHGAHIVNISAGQFAPSGQAIPFLADTLRRCAAAGVLIVAAAGNEGCECLHVPAAVDSVLAVGAMDARGEPLAFSNWGRAYRLQGVLAPGANIPVAQPGGGTALGTGTSYATAIVSGLAGLLLSLQLQRGKQPNPASVREAILRTALGCEYQPTTDCRRLLAGRLNVKGAVSYITREIDTMSETVQTPSSVPLSEVSGGNGADGSTITAQAAKPALSESLAPAQSSAVSPAACNCPRAGGSQFVYALGQLGYDLSSEARLDSLVQKMGAHFGATSSERLLAFDPRQMLRYLERHPWDAAAIEWTLNLDGNPIYALRPQGPFAADTYAELRKLLRERLDEGAERVSVPGVLAGEATLLIGQSVPVLVPELRGMYSWTTRALVESVVGSAPAADAPSEIKEQHERKRTGVHNFLERVYHELRNLGVTPLERAMNFSATNAFQIEKIYESVLKEKERMELDGISVTRSPICRPHSDCWDVELTFFFPDRPVQTVRKIYRFAVDVSDVVPVTVGKTRSWFAR